jgi:hypothetical protein
MQYVFHSVTASRHRGHIQRFIDDAKEIAWRPHGGNAPVSAVRKYVTLADQSEDGVGPSRKFAVEFDGRVFFVDDKTGEEALLNVDEIEGASWRRTLLYSLPVFCWNLAAQRVLKTKGINNAVGEMERLEEVTETNGNGPTDKPKYTKVEKVAGGRRKSKKKN